MKAVFHLATLDIYVRSIWFARLFRHLPQEQGTRKSSSFGQFIDCKYVTAKTLDFSSHIDAVCIYWNRQVQWNIEQIETPEQSNNK